MGLYILNEKRGFLERLRQVQGLQVTVVVDGGTPEVKPRFDAFCTYHRLATLSVGEKLPEGVHTVTLTIHADQPDKARILSQRNEKMDDPKRFDGTCWYAGALLVIGEVVP